MFCGFRMRSEKCFPQHINFTLPLSQILVKAPLKYEKECVKLKMYLDG